MTDKRLGAMTPDEAEEYVVGPLDKQIEELEKKEAAIRALLARCKDRFRPIADQI